MSLHQRQTVEGHVAHTKIQKSGNSAAVLVPAAVMRALGLEVGASVQVSVQGRAMIIESSAPVYSLSLLCFEHLSDGLRQGGKRLRQVATR
jgi:antitoxin component of MazEF toxin-antitoxin module